MPRPAIALLATLFILASGPAAHAADRPVLARSSLDATIHSSVGGPAKAEVDTVYLLGGPDRLDGAFENAAGDPDWQGWTSIDETFDPSAYWQVSDFMAPNGQYAMWCGTEFEGGERGYGNSWNQSLVFSHEVADNQVASTVLWTATLHYDSEPDYDYTYLEVNRGGEWQELQAYDGQGVVAISEAVVVAPEDYVGTGSNEIQLRVRFQSDGAWSDADGLWDTDGACQLDDVTVTIDGVVVDFEDFEDQISDRWLQVLVTGVGDFAALYLGLLDLDVCRSNDTPQVAFIDNGIVVPGTGGTQCITWCYGPGGFIVNNTGGLKGPEFHLNNNILSPVIDWVDGCDGARFAFDVYRHEEMGPDSPGMFYDWNVRSTDGSHPIEDSLFGGRGFAWIGGPEYYRHDEIVTDLMVPDRIQVQFKLSVFEFGWAWGWNGEDGTPAPYFDNVSFRVWPQTAPEIVTRAIDLANDGFPASGELDLDNLAANSVRFDMARNISPSQHLRNDPGDSIVVEVHVVRAGAVLDGLPQMHVRLKANPLFDAVRTLPPGFSQTNAIVAGVVEADSCFHPDGPLSPDRWNFDLPDAGFFYPGDVIHYFIEVSDNLSGNIGTALLPADTTGFASFDHDLRFDSNFIVRALPAQFSAIPGDQPRILFWDDFGDHGGQNHWHYALKSLGLREGETYDIYATNGPSSGVGNGLGGRATPAVLAGYDILLYSSGNLTLFLLSNGDFESDPSDDLAVISNWFALGGKKAFMTGDNLVSGLLNEGSQGQEFVSTYFNVNPIAANLNPYISAQTAPLVAIDPGNGIIFTADTWITYGGCPDINTFDAIEVLAGASRLAEFTDPDGNTGVYSYAAAVHNHHAAQDANVVLMPTDFATILNAPGWTPPLGRPMAARTAILQDVLWFFDVLISVPPVAVTPDAALSVRHYPNPFNPATTIALNLPRAGEVSLKIYDVRGQLVRTLVDERLAAGHHEIVWNGTDDRGATVASGVYFSEVKAGDEVRVHKLALIK